MSELILAIAELLGATSAALRARNVASSPVFVAPWVASLAFALFGFVVAGPVAWAAPSLHPLITISAMFLLVLVLTAAAVLAGLKPGFSLRWPAVASYAVCFIFGAYALVLLAHGGV